MLNPLTTLTLLALGAGSASAAAVHAQPPHGAHLEARASTSCASGKYFNNEFKKCYPCGENALTCKSTSIALTCKKGYTVQEGYCKTPKASTVKKTTTTKKTASTSTKKATAATTSKAAAADAAVTKTVTLAAATATVTAACTNDDEDDDGDDTVYLTYTSTVTVTTTAATATSTRTVTLTSTITSVSTSLVTTTAVSTVSAAQSTARAGSLQYAGCFSTSQLATFQLDNERITSPTPFTASTAVAECLYKLAATNAKFGYTYTHCQVQGNLVYLYAMDKSSYSALPGKAADANCDQVCSVDKTVTNIYGTEYCGSNSGSYNSVYTLPAVA